ncbi:hypothetical protein ACFQH2_01695 [Natronoarchaeum sp. GCM10025703]|uniref:hypothetical protein n=1 Tax=Natronoarchaeum sp. GCM10025703 TaxID=3252685 RepID=UPI003622383D
MYDAEVEAGEEKLERLRALEAEYDNPIFEHWLGRCLFDAVRANVETARAERAQELADELAEYAVGHQDQEQIEAGLDTLRSQAPTIFGDEEPTLGDDLDDPVKTSATGGSVSDPATNGGSTGDGPELSRLDERATVEGSQELSEAIDLLDDGGHEGGPVAPAAVRAVTPSRTWPNRRAAPLSWRASSSPRRSSSRSHMPAIDWSNSARPRFATANDDVTPRLRDTDSHPFCRFGPRYPAWFRGNRER